MTLPTKTSFTLEEALEFLDEAYDCLQFSAMNAGDDEKAIIEWIKEELYNYNDLKDS